MLEVSNKVDNSETIWKLIPFVDQSNYWHLMVSTVTETIDHERVEGILVYWHTPWSFEPAGCTHSLEREMNGQKTLVYSLIE